ncbi:hypothetical protein GCM10009558_033390 [Virgisporangium aurantiacum]
MTRSARYVGDRRIVVGDADPVPPGPGQVRIDVAYTGICGTDLHIMHGAMDRRVHTPAVIGHEMSGRIAALGAGVTDHAVGDPVTVMPLDWCGNCPACHAGHTHICHRLNFVGIDSAGSMQHSWTVPARILVPLPADLPLRRAALIEPTAVAVHDVRRSRLTAGERSVVIGAGPVGLLIAKVAQTTGATVTVVEIDPDRRAVAVSFAGAGANSAVAGSDAWPRRAAAWAGTGATVAGTHAAVGRLFGWDVHRVGGGACQAGGTGPVQHAVKRGSGFAIRAAIG